VHVSAFVHVASVTITIGEEAYRALKRRKKEKESFTDVILRLASEKGSVRGLLDYYRSDEFTPMSDETAKLIEQASKELRRNFKLREVKL
jgi:predicted CopG family antitoxin